MNYMFLFGFWLHCVFVSMFSPSRFDFSSLCLWGRAQHLTASAAQLDSSRNKKHSTLQYQNHLYINDHKWIIYKLLHMINVSINVCLQDGAKVHLRIHLIIISPWFLPKPHTASSKWWLTQVSPGGHFTVLLQRWLCHGSGYGFGQCNMPPLDEGLTYAEVSGCQHTVLLRSDGSAVACGRNDHGQCNIPCLDCGTAYIHISAGYQHTVLLRSDGTAVAFGRNENCQCDIPPLQPGMFYVGDQLASSMLVQLDFVCECDGLVLICSNLLGEEKNRVKAKPDDLAWDTHRCIAREMKAPLQSLQLILPDGQLLAKVCRASPSATVADVSTGRSGL